MKKIDTRTLIALFVSGVLFAAAAQARWSVKEDQKLEETFTFTNATANLVVVDNINGSIEVVGHDGDEVRMIAHERFRARSQSDMERAREEAGLAIEAEGDALYLIVDGPFRRRDGGIDWRDDLGYDLYYDFELRVPRQTRLKLRTVNHGDIEVEGVEGEFDVSNVNGTIDMEQVAGHGRIHTVNGGIDVSFTRRPEGACDFKTINGNVDIDFPDDLAADLRFKTFNGDVYTEFDYTPVALERPEPKRRGSRRVWKSLGSGARIGGGGPEMSFETLNGNVYIRNSDR